MKNQIARPTSTTSAPKPPANRRSGAAMVEMALVAPIFFMVVLGIIEFGRAMMVGQLVTNAAREGARLAVVGNSTNAEVTAHINEFLLNSGSIEATDITIEITITPYPGNPTPVSDVEDASSRDLVSIEVAVPYSAVSFLPPKTLGSTTIVGRTAMRCE